MSQRALSTNPLPPVPPVGALTRTIRAWLRRTPPTDLHFSSEEFIRSLHLIVGLDLLLDTFSAKLREFLDADAVYVVLFEPVTNRYAGKKAKGNHPEWLSTLNFSPSDHLIRWLQVNQAPLDVPGAEGVVAFLSEREREVLRQADCVLVAPLIVLNRLSGVVFVSERRNGKAYSATEITFLSRLTNQSALAIEYAARRQFQEERLTKLLHADRLATVGELAAGVAHEIRNPLTAIRSTVQYVSKDLSGRNKDLITGVIEEVDRIDQIIRGLLSFSRASELRIVDVDIEELLDQTVFLLHLEFQQHNVTVQRHTDLAELRIPADASQLKQVFLNILMNSIQAMPGGGTITITATEIVKQRREFICVIISDTGLGIPEHALSRVFDPFYTTKETGTGLGLSIAYGIVSKHGGEIEIESVPEGPVTGTTIHLRLPKVRGDVDG